MAKPRLSISASIVLAYILRPPSGAAQTDVRDSIGANPISRPFSMAPMTFAAVSLAKFSGVAGIPGGTFFGTRARGINADPVNFSAIFSNVSKSASVGRLCSRRMSCVFSDISFRVTQFYPHRDSFVNTYCNFLRPAGCPTGLSFANGIITSADAPASRRG